MKNENCTVDVVIPVYKPGASLMRLLTMLSKQTVTPNKTVLMVTRAEGETLPDFSEYGNTEVHELTPETFDHAATRNAGIGYSEADYVLLMTQDAVPEDCYLIEELLNGFQADPRVAVSYARQKPAKDCKIIERLTRKFNYPTESALKTKEDIDRLGIKTFFCSDVCAMYDRKAFLQNGGFAAPAIFNEDMLYAFRAVTRGGAVFYSAAARVVHSHNLKLSEQFRRNFDLGVSQAEHPEVFENISSEKEGGSMFKTVVKELWHIGRFYMIPYFVLQCGVKFTGFKLGKHFKKLSPKFVRWCSLNKYYWKDTENGTD